MSYQLKTPEGRQLATKSYGDPDGKPVFLLHGTPGSRLGPRPRGAVLHRLGIQLITYDRPGYGKSDRHEGRRVADAATDVLTMADAYGVDKFAVVGRSGGGPHALACAALMPERITKAAVLVGLAPQGAKGLDWYDGMTRYNVYEYKAAAKGYDGLAAMTEATAEAVRVDPASLLASLHPEMPDSDRRVVADPGIRAQLLETYAEALRTSADGWIDDVLAFRRPWGFDPSTIRIPVLLWHGAVDNFSPVGHAMWLAQRIASATVVVQAGAAHFSALDVLPDILRWLSSETQAS